MAFIEMGRTGGGALFVGEDQEFKVGFTEEVIMWAKQEDMIAKGKYQIKMCNKK